MTDLDDLEKLADEYLQLVVTSAAKSWDEKKPKNLAKALMGGKSHPFAACVKKMKGKVKTPEAFCAKLKDIHKGTTKWRSEEQKKNKKKKEKK